MNETAMQQNISQVEGRSEAFRPSPDWLEETLFSQVNDEKKLYAIIDGQWCRDIYGRLQTYQNELAWTGLIAGEQAETLALTSPYLVRLEKGHKLSQWLFEEGWGQGWGIYFLAKLPLLVSYRTPPPEPHRNQLVRGAFVSAPGIEEDTANDVVLLRRHFRRFQRVEFEDDGRLVRFRFFDPAVLRVYLMSCNKEEISAFFGPAITDFIFEDYCEEPSLSNPGKLYRYFLSATGVEGRKHDIQTGAMKIIQPSEAAQEGRERAGSGLVPLIRNGQIAVFKKMQMEIFREKIAKELIFSGEVECFRKDNYEMVRLFVNKHFAKAQKYKLCTQYDLMGYVFCAWRLGEDFDTSRQDFKGALVNHDAEKLASLFDTHVYNYKNEGSGDV